MASKISADTHSEFTAYGWSCRMVLEVSPHIGVISNKLYKSRK